MTATKQIYTRLGMGMVAVLLTLAYVPPNQMAEARRIFWSGTGSWHSWYGARAKARRTNKPICLFVYTDWCPHCHRTARMFRRADMRRVMKHFVMVRYNASQRASWFRRRYQPIVGSAIPKLLFFNNRRQFLRNITSGSPRYPFTYNYRYPIRLKWNMLALACRTRVPGACRDFQTLKRRQARRSGRLTWKQLKQRFKLQQKRPLARRGELILRGQQRLQKHRHVQDIPKNMRNQEPMRRETDSNVHVSPEFLSFYKQKCRKRRSKAHCWALIRSFEQGKTEAERKKAIPQAKWACHRLRWAKACAKVGQLYRHGVGTKYNNKRAGQYFKRACRMRDGFACAKMGFFYSKGWGGVYKSCRLSNRMYQKACLYRYKRACQMSCK